MWKRDEILNVLNKKTKVSEPYSKPKVVVKKHGNKTENAKTPAVLVIFLSIRGPP